MLRSAAFQRSEHLRGFLRFVCEMERAGRAEEITEHRIGVEVMGRPADYLTVEDSIVRRRASDLRSKLEEAYQGELAAAPWRIELPKGRYVPRFVAATGGARRRLFASRDYWWGLASGMAAAGAVALAFLLMLRPPAPAPPTPAPEPGASYEAESTANELHGSTAVGGCAACSGGARVRNLGKSPANYVLLRQVSVSKAGRYTLLIDYVLHGSRVLFVSVNGGSGVELALHGESWSVPARASLLVTLDAGGNTLKFYNDTAVAPDLDRVVVR